MVDKTVGKSTETTTEMTAMVEVGTGPERCPFPETMAIIELEAQAIVDPGQDASTNRDRIHYYKCRENNHFARDCPTSREEREVEQLQIMLNLGDEKITPLMSDTLEDHFRMCSEEKLRPNHLNL